MNWCFAHETYLTDEYYSPDAGEILNGCADKHPGIQVTTVSASEPEHEQSPAGFEEIVHALFSEAAELLLRKHRDYGPGNIAGAPGGPLNGLRVRLYDKLARLNNLIDSDREPEFETLIDTLMDIGCYGLIGVLVERGDWPTLEKP